jgi:hypothetical protein
MLRPAVLVIAAIVGGCALEPEYEAPGERSYYCYLEEPVWQLTIEFARNTATVSDSGKRVELTFVTSAWPRFEDLYEGQGYTLTLDPEARLATPDGRVIGPCQP